jgi:hypothetical protein
MNVLDFKKALEASRKALNYAGIPFHLHSGTALGAWRTGTFIPYDVDIDLGVFYKDLSTPAAEIYLINSMKKFGFELVDVQNNLDRGREYIFDYMETEGEPVPLDIFLVYEGKYRGKNIHWVGSSSGTGGAESICDQLPYKLCVWGYRRYKPRTIKFLGKRYKIIPKKTLVDMYGKNWKTPMVYDYFSGISEGYYKGLLKDYFLQNYYN